MIFHHEISSKYIPSTLPSLSKRPAALQQSSRQPFKAIDEINTSRKGHLFNSETRNKRTKTWEKTLRLRTETLNIFISHENRWDGYSKFPATSRFSSEKKFSEDGRSSTSLKTTSEGQGLAGVKPTQGAASKHPTRTSKPSDHGLLEGWASLLRAVLSSLGDATFHSVPTKNSRKTAGKNFPKISKVLQQQASHLQPVWNPGRLKDQSSHSSASVPLASSRVGFSRAVRFSSRIQALNPATPLLRLPRIRRAMTSAANKGSGRNRDHPSNW